MVLKGPPERRNISRIFCNRSKFSNYLLNLRNGYPPVRGNRHSQGATSCRRASSPSRGQLRQLTKNLEIAGLADVVAPIKPLMREPSLHRCSDDDSFAPAMAMYAKGKVVRISPGYVTQQQDQWMIALNTASRVFISGVRVIKEDQHIWDSLAKTKANTTYFGRPDSRAEFAAWKETCGKKNLYFVEADFEKCIDHMKMHLAKRRM